MYRPVPFQIQIKQEAEADSINKKSTI